MRLALDLDVTAFRLGTAAEIAAHQRAKETAAIDRATKQLEDGALKGLRTN